MVAFQSLGELGSWLDTNPDVRIVDAGIPLSYYATNSEYGPVWESQPSVRKVVDFIARNVASIPIHLFDRVSDTDRRRVTTGDLAEVAAKPSPSTTAFRFWHSTLVDALLFDRWCAMKVGGNAAPLRLHRIPARRVAFKTDALDIVEKVVVYGKDGKATEHDPSRFVFDAGYSERGGAGTAPTTTLKHLLDETREAVGYRRSVWKRGARIPAVIERPKPWPSDAARDRFVAGWRAFESGGGREGATPVLEDDMKYRELNGFNPKDTLDLEGRKLTDIEVASAYHIAPELVGAREGTFSNLLAFKQMLYGVALGPYIVARDQVLNELAAGTSFYFESNVEAKLRGSFEEQGKILQSATGAPWMTRNEARALRNLPPVDGGDELVVPLNVIEGGQASPTDSGSQNES